MLYNFSLPTWLLPSPKSPQYFTYMVLIAPKTSLMPFFFPPLSSVLNKSTRAIQIKHKSCILTSHYLWLPVVLYLIRIEIKLLKYHKGTTHSVPQIPYLNRHSTQASNCTLLHSPFLPLSYISCLAVFQPKYAVSISWLLHTWFALPDVLFTQITLLQSCSMSLPSTTY